MTKINTEYLKQNVKCNKCQSTNIKHRHKQSFNSSVDENGLPNKQKIYWRKFECISCKNTTNVINNDDHIISQTHDVVLPFSSFYYTPSLEDSAIGFFLFYIDKINEDLVIHDNVRNDNILGFVKFFKKHHIDITNSMENCWEMTFDKEFYDFKNLPEAYEFSKSLLKKAGADFSLTEEIEEADEGLECLTFEDIIIYT